MATKYEPISPPKPAKAEGGISTVNMLILVAGLLGAIYLYRQPASPDDKPDDKPAVVADPRLDDAISVIEQADPKKTKPLGELFLAMGDMLLRIDPVDSADMREWIVSTQLYRVQGTDLGIGIGPELNALFESVLTLEQRTLTADEQKGIAELLIALGQACIDG